MPKFNKDTLVGRELIREKFCFLRFAKGYTCVSITKLKNKANLQSAGQICIVLNTHKFIYNFLNILLQSVLPVFIFNLIDLVHFTCIYNHLICHKHSLQIIPHIFRKLFSNCFLEQVMWHVG